MKFSDPNHPIWDIIKSAVYMLGLVFILRENAQHFDATEIRSIMQFGILLMFAEGARRGGLMMKKHSESQTP